MDHSPGSVKEIRSGIAVHFAALLGFAGNAQPAGAY